MLTMTYGAVGDDLVVAVCGREPLSVADWSELERCVEDLLRPLRPARRAIKILVFTDEGAPNARQRASIVGLLRGATARVAVVTSSVIARNVVTAFGWLRMPMKGFAPTQVSSVAPYLELSNEQLDQALSQAAALAPRIGRVECVEVAVAARNTGAQLR